MLSGNDIDTISQPNGIFTTDTGASLTPNQFKVMSKLVELGRSVGAYELLDLLRPEGVRAIPTVYRALNQLVAKGLVRHIASTRSFTAFMGQETPDADTLMLICKQCDTVTPFKDAEIAKALACNADQHGFNVHAKRLELVGTCAACQSSKPRKF